MKNMGKKLLSLEKIKIARLTNLIKIKGGLSIIVNSLVFRYDIHRDVLSTKTKPIGYTAFCKADFG